MANELDQKQINRIVDAKIYEALRLVLKENFFYYYSQQNLIISVLKNRKTIAGVGYNPKTKKFYLLFNEESVLKASVLDLAGLIQHECNHILFNHPNSNLLENFLKIRPRLNEIKNKIKNADSESKLGLNQEYSQIMKEYKKEHSLLNKAQDYLINEACSFINKRYQQEFKQENCFSILKHGCFYGDLQNVFPEIKNIPYENWTAFSLYKFLKTKNQESTLDESFDESEISIVEDNGIDGVRELSSEEMSQESNQQALKEALDRMSDEKKSMIFEAIKKSQEQKKDLKQILDQVSGSLKIDIESMIACKTNKGYLMQFVKSVKQQKYKKTWKRLHRRYPYQAKPKREIKRANMVMGIDSSGSMLTPELKDMIAYQVNKLSQSCDNLWVVVGDTRLVYKVLIKNHKDFSLEKIRFVGGGGTSLQFMWDFSKEVKADGLIVNTDGYISPFDDKGINTLFFIYPNGLNVEGYKNIRVEKL